MELNCTRVVYFDRNHPLAYCSYCSLTYTVFSDAIGVENETIIKDDCMVASYGTLASYQARKGRLNLPEASWEATDYGASFLEITFGRKLSMITAVATQGSGKLQNWVKTYMLSFSMWGDEWMVYTEDGKAKVRKDFLIGTF